MATSLEDIGRSTTAVQSWFMEFEDVPETLLHDLIIELLKLVLKHRFRDHDAVVASNVACRWDPEDRRVGVDPDVILLQPAPPEGEELKALCVWRPEHRAPRLAVEIVSETNAAKDYVEGPLRLAKLGADELWIFDPGRHGPRQGGGPFELQIWRRSGSEASTMERIHAGDAPARSPVLDAWVITTEAGQRLRIADDPHGEALWPTQAEAAEGKVEAAESKAEAAEAEVRRLRALIKEMT